MSFIASDKRYDKMIYNRCGKSGLRLSAVSLGLWHNFGTNANDNYGNMKAMLETAFDLGITHFDLANNYGPYPGSAEENFGRIFAEEFKGYRDELIISSKAGHPMWDGPYGDGGSLKYLTASIDQSLKRTGLEYFDIFYHHRPDKDTPLEETAIALDRIVRSGKALYVGISKYSPEDTKKMAAIMRELKTPLLIHQMRYNMFTRDAETSGLFDVLADEGMGSIAFSPLDQGILTNKYADGIPENSRVAKGGFLTREKITADKLAKVKELIEVAAARGQSMTQTALAWDLYRGRLTSVIIGASSPSQIKENVAALDNTEFTDEEIRKIDTILKR